MGVDDGAVATWPMKRSLDVALAFMLGLSWGALAYLMGPRGHVLAWGIWLAMLLTVGWIWHPTWWQLRHPRRAWWMAHTGQALARRYEAEYDAEIQQQAAPRLVIAPSVQGYRYAVARGTGEQPVRADWVSESEMPERVRIQVPAHAWSVFGPYHGLEGRILDTQPMAARGEGAYTVLLPGGQRFQVPVAYCVRIAKGASYAP